MIRKLVLFGSLVALGTVLVPMASANSFGLEVPPPPPPSSIPSSSPSGISGDTFHLNVDYCGGNCLGSTAGGTVVLTSSAAGSVTITVTLTSPLNFHNTNAFDVFSFNCTTCSGTVTFSNFNSSNFGVPGGGTTETAGSHHEDGAGNFQFVVGWVGGGPGVTGATTLSFTITGTGVSIPGIETTNSGASNVDFAAAVTTTGLPTNCTGVIGGGNGTSDSTTVVHSGSVGGTGGTCGGTPPGVPEPTSILLLGSALAFAGKLLRARLAV